jgi:hypothetical protein
MAGCNKRGVLHHHGRNTGHHQGEDAQRGADREIAPFWAPSERNDSSPPLPQNVRQSRQPRSLEEEAMHNAQICVSRCGLGHVQRKNRRRENRLPERDAENEKEVNPSFPARDSRGRTNDVGRQFGLDNAHGRGF